MKRSKGFTLIELLAEIVILAIIAFIATPIVLKYINTSKDGADENSFKAIERAAELYYTSNMIDGNEPKTIYFPDEENVLGLKGTKPTDGMVSITSDGKIKVIATINDKTYMSEGSGLFGINHYFTATGSVTGTSDEWEYEKINDTDVRLTKYIGYKYNYTDDLNNLNIVSEKSYNQITNENYTNDKSAQYETYFSAVLMNMTYPASERKSLADVLTIMGVDVTSYDDDVKEEGETFYNLVNTNFADKCEDGLKTDDETEMEQLALELVELVNSNKKQIPTIALLLGLGGEEKQYLTAFIFPARLKTSDGTIYNVTEIGATTSNFTGDCTQKKYSLFESIDLYNTCSSGGVSSANSYINEFDKIIIPEGVTALYGYVLEFMDTKELSLPSTLIKLNPFNHVGGYGHRYTLRSLQELVIPANVEIIRNKTVLPSLSSLKSIVFEGVNDSTSKLKTIEGIAFEFTQQSGDMTIYVPGSVETIYSSSFYTTNSNLNINVIIKKDDCSSYSLINSDNVTFTCES